MTSNNDPHDPHFCLPSSSTIPNTNHHQKPRKNRTKKWIEIESYLVLSRASTLTAAKKPKFSGKRPDPSAPKITRPCSECGKKFWSWKALCGHMRCHPERQWRGINPPPNYRRSVLPTQQLSSSTTAINVETPMTDEDHDVASCLLMLANSDSATLLTLETTGFGDGVRGICNNNRTSQVEDDDWEKGEEASISSSMNQGFHFLAARERPQLACRNRR
uniref:C2H2-type domain-containing protein n=1 Tax=Salix viminalis TaxID=40686 RepID=A0A6N2L8E1_SALVM